MIASIAILLIVAAAFLVMFSGTLGEDGGKRARARAGHLILMAIFIVIAQPFVLALLHSAPWYAGLFAAAVSLIAFAILEARHTDTPRVPLRTFVNYRGSGKVPVHEEEPFARDESDGEPGAERDELL